MRAIFNVQFTLFGPFALKLSCGVGLETIKPLRHFVALKPTSLKYVKVNLSLLLNKQRSMKIKGKYIYRFTQSRLL